MVITFFILPSQVKLSVPYDLLLHIFLEISGAVVAGGFGMNLTHGLEDHPTAFCITSGATVALMTALFGLLMRRFRLLDLDSTRYFFRSSRSILFKGLKFCYDYDQSWFLDDGTRFFAPFVIRNNSFQFQSSPDKPVPCTEEFPGCR